MIKPDQLSWNRKAGYAVGDFALNLFYTFCTLFLLYYYTDVLGLSPTNAGFVIMAALLIEGVLDPLMGFVTNRTRSPFGRYRPYLLFGALPLCLSFVSMFIPTGLSGAPLLAYVMGTHLLFRTIYTVVGIPYNALSAELTIDSQQRSEIAGLRMVFALACALLLATATLPLSSWFGGGQIGFFWLSAIYALIAFFIFLLCFKATREASDVRQESPSIGAMLSMLRANWPLQLILVATIFASVGSTLANKTLIYYLKYYAGSEAAVTPALTIFAASAGLAVPFWVLLIGKWSKRVVWLIASAVVIINYLIIFAVAPSVGPPLWILLCIHGIGNGAFPIAYWAMIPDTVEFGEWKTGIRAEGAIYGLVSLTQKIALGVGVGMLGLLLDAIGYAPNTPQSGATLDGIKVLLTLAPATLVAITGGIIWAYPLDHKLHGRLARALAWRGIRSGT